MPRLAANISLMFTELPFMERFAAAARAGFRGVEFLFPYDHDAQEIRAALDAAGLEVALFNCPPGDGEGERGLSALPGREAAFRESFAIALEYAAIIRPSRLHVMAGIVEGAAAHGTYVGNLGWATAQASGQVLTIEPINTRDMPGYFLNRSDQAAAVMAEVDAPNLRLQLDLYHAQIMEGDLTRRLARLMPLIGHVQIAGVPDRHEPDAGELNLPHLFAELDRLGYQGWVGCEYHPAGRTEYGLGWFHRAMGQGA